MFNRAWFTLMLIASLAPLPAHAQSDVWRDPSPHSTRFVTVEPDVRLEVLDWGGSGRPIILLDGLGGTAHGFDDFAPKLTSMGHVYGITRRGFGASSAPRSGYQADQLGDDVLAVMKSLDIVKPVLVGESLGGEELSSIGSRYPDRVSGLVYLDAAYAYAFDNGKGMTLEEMRALLNGKQPEMPVPQASDLASVKAFQAWFSRNGGVTLPESELRQMFAVAPDGRVGERSLNSYAPAAIVAGMKKYTDIRLPILALFALPHDPGPWMSSLTDAKTLEAIAAVDSAAEKQAKALEEALPDAHVVRLHAQHVIFISNEADVLQEMRTFLAETH